MAKTDFLLYTLTSMQRLSENELLGVLGFWSCFVRCVLRSNLCLKNSFVYFVCHWLIFTIFVKVLICIGTSFLQLVSAHGRMPEFIFCHLWAILKLCITNCLPYYTFFIPTLINSFILQLIGSLCKSHHPFGNDLV